MSGSQTAADQPPEQWITYATDEEAAAAQPELDLGDPLFVATAFCQGLGDPVTYRDVLLLLAAPDSDGRWGDFSEAAGVLRAIDSPGFGTVVDRAAGAPDVAYFKILAGVTRALLVVDDQVIGAAAVLTLVKRRGRWYAYHLGKPVLPELIRRSPS